MIPSFTPRRKFLLFGDLVLILTATQLAPWVRLGKFFPIFQVNTGASVFTLLLYLTMFYIFDLYNLRRTFALKNTPLRTAIAVAFAFVGSTLIFYSLPSWRFGRGILLIQMILAWTFLTGWRLLFSFIFRMATGKKDVLVLGVGHCGMTLCRLLASPLSPYRVIGFLDDDPLKQGKVVECAKVIGFTHQLGEFATSMGIKTAILAVTRNRPSSLIKQLLEFRLKGVDILDMPAVYEQLTRRIPVGHIRDEWIIFATGFYLVLTDYVQKIKRLIDFGGSTFLLLLSFPVIAATALAIRLDSAGPIFFKQERVGKDDTIFTLWKFRSMRSDAEENGAVWAGEKDPRITRIGKWIRLLRIDELPQLINVFRGEMSLIGPRPERPEFIKELAEKIPYYYLRHAVRPGITGWAQVNYRYGASVEDARFKLEYDLYYIKNMSLILDLKILLRTIGVVLFGQGAR